MMHTEFSWMSSDELLQHVNNLPDAPSLAIELAQRLALALDELEEEHDA